MAGGLVAGLDVDKLGPLMATDLLGLGAAGMKAASGRGVDGRWHFSFERHLCTRLSESGIGQTGGGNGEFGSVENSNSMQELER